MSRAHPVVAALVCVAVSAATLPVLAEPTAQDNAIAKDLFDKGVRLMEDAKCDEAPTSVPKCREARDAFKRAYEITGALGALRNLAYVEKGLGLIASAARDFREVARRAPLDPKPERRAWADYAREEADALEPRVPHLTVKLAEAPPGAKITLDGLPLPPAAWNTSVPVDPGPHSVHAEAPGRLTFDGTATLAEKQAKTIAVALDPEVRANDTKGPSRVPPLIVAGIGIVGVGVGLTLGYASMKKRDEACDADKLCDPGGLAYGRSLANASTVVTAVGAAAVVGGVIWYALTPSGSSSSMRDGDRAATIAPWASAEGGGLAAFGSF